MTSGPSTTRTIVITGGSDGIGAVAARELAGPDVNLIVIGRSPEKLARVAADTGATTFAADFSDLSHVRELAAEVAAHTDSIDVLMNNAGGTFPPAQRTVDGHEPNFQINHLSPFLLTNLLREPLANGSGALVLNTASVANRWGRVDPTDLDYDRRRTPFSLESYGTSKLMTVMFTKGIAQRWSDDGIVSAAVHPGTVATSFGSQSALINLGFRTPLRHLGPRTPESGAAPLVAMARRGADPALNGLYYVRYRENGRLSPQARDQRLIDGLWDASVQYTGL